jgi:hypothetical protein
MRLLRRGCGGVDRPEDKGWKPLGRIDWKSMPRRCMPTGSAGDTKLEQARALPKQNSVFKVLIDKNVYLFIVL